MQDRTAQRRAEQGRIKQDITRQGRTGVCRAEIDRPIDLPRRETWTDTEVIGKIIHSGCSYNLVPSVPASFTKLHELHHFDLSASSVRARIDYDVISLLCL